MSAPVYLIDATGALGYLHSYQVKLANLDPVYAGMSAVLQKMVDLEFREQKDPWGTPWEKLSDVTLRLRRKEGKGAKILRDTGILQNSLVPFFDASGVTLGTNVPYGPHHQYGIGTFLPRRAFLPLNETGDAKFPSSTVFQIVDVLDQYFNSL